MTDPFRRQAKAVGLDETLDELSAFIETYDRLPITPRRNTLTCRCPFGCPTPDFITEFTTKNIVL